METTFDMTMMCVPHKTLSCKWTADTDGRGCRGEVRERMALHCSWQRAVESDRSATRRADYNAGERGCPA
jgi:hypothetical protein